MTTLTAAVPVTQSTLNLRVSLTAAAVSAVGVISAALVLLYLRAVPYPFLLLVSGMAAAFSGGLIMRIVHVGDPKKKLMAMALSAGVISVAILLALVVARLLAGALMPPPAEALNRADRAFAAMHTFLATALGSPNNVLIILALGAVIAAFATGAGHPALFLGVPLTLYFAWIIFPSVLTGVIAFTDWDGSSGLHTAKFVELYNFNFVLGDQEFKLAFLNNIKWLAFFILIPTSMGLGMAMIFNTSFPGARIFKIAFFAPLVISPVVVAQVWSAMYRPDIGLINSFLHFITGIPYSDLPGWLGDKNLALWCIIIAATWRQVGYVMILYLAGLKSLDPTLIEAATVDGANPWQRFWNVIFPLLGPVTVVVAVISVIDSLRAFDLVATTTAGQPDGATQVIANYMYMRAFNDYRMGFAAASAIILLGLMAIFIVPYLIRTARTELEY